VEFAENERMPAEDVVPEDRSDAAFAQPCADFVYIVDIKGAFASPFLLFLTSRTHTQLTGFIGTDMHEAAVREIQQHLLRQLSLLKNVNPYRVRIYTHQKSLITSSEFLV